jgi:hypothetical protein
VKVAKKVRAQAAAQVLLAGVVTVASTAAIGLAGTQDVSLTGVSATGGVSTVLIDADATSVATGVSATGGVNTVTTSGKANVTLGGAVSITTAQPLVAAVSGPIIDLTTLVSTSAIGSMTVRPYARVFPTTVSAAGGVGTLRSQMPPVWTATPTVEVASNTPIGTVVWTATDYVSDPDNDPMTVTMTGSLPSGLSYSSTTKQVTVTSSLTQGNSSTVAFDASDGYVTDLATQDWQTRSEGAGVIWAHNFEHENEVLNFLINPLGHNDPAQTWAAANYPLQVRHGTDGIAGGGCLEMEVIAADVAYARDPSNPYSRGSWIRPYSPMLTDTPGNPTTGSGTGQTDRGASLVAGGAKVWRPASVGRSAQDFRAGVYGHTDYKTATNQLGQNRGEAAGWVWEGDQTTPFYIQCRIKVPAHRFTATRVIPANGQVYPSGDPLAGQVQTFWNNSSTVTAPRQPGAKVMWWAHAPSNLASFTTPAHEIVQTGFDKQSYNSSTHQMRVYSGQNASFDIVNNISGAVPAGTSPSPTLPWEWPADKWVTVLMYVQPGHFTGETSFLPSGPSGSLVGGDTTVRFWAAYDGSDYVFLGGGTTAKLWCYDSGSDDTGPLGWNAIVPTNFANGPEGWANQSSYRDPTAQTACTQTWTTKFTQIIFSRAWIPPPAAGA